MLDIFMMVIGLVFFVLTGLFVKLCDRLGKEK